MCKDVGSGLQPEDDCVIVHPDRHCASFWPVLNELRLGIQEKAAFAEVGQERGVLLDHPDDAEPLARRELRERTAVGLPHRPVSPGNGIAVEVETWVAEVDVDPLEQPIGGRVLQAIGLLADLVPGDAECPGKERLQPSSVPVDFSYLIAARP